MRKTLNFQIQFIEQNLAGHLSIPCHKQCFKRESENIENFINPTQTACVSDANIRSVELYMKIDGDGDGDNNTSRRLYSRQLIGYCENLMGVSQRIINYPLSGIFVVSVHSVRTHLSRLFHSNVLEQPYRENIKISFQGNIVTDAMIFPKAMQNGL